MKWLPDLVLFSDYHGNWEEYVEVLYQYFCTDFVRSRPNYQGKKVVLSRQPLILGKDATFWHIISEGKIEEERIPDLRRCERIRWPKPIIEHAHQETGIKVWENTRKNGKRVCLWFEEVDYLVILAIRKGYFMLMTAYLVEQPHRKRKLQKEYEQYIARKKG